MVVGELSSRHSGAFPQSWLEFESRKNIFFAQSQMEKVRKLWPYAKTWTRIHVAIVQALITTVVRLRTSLTEVLKKSPRFWRIEKVGYILKIHFATLKALVIWNSRRMYVWETFFQIKEGWKPWTQPEIMRNLLWDTFMLTELTIYSWTFFRLRPFIQRPFLFHIPCELSPHKIDGKTASCGNFPPRESWCFALKNY